MNAKTVELRIPIKIPPFTLLISKMTAINNPAIPIRTSGPSTPSPTKVASFFTTKPIFFKPIKVINNPIPAPTAILIDSGIQSAILSRIPPNDKMKKKHPDKNTIPKAVSQVTPLSMTKVKVKKAFNPIPGANPNGAFAQTPEINVPNAVAKQVTVIRAPLSIPVKLKIEGFTNIMYAIAKKVVSPPMTSFLTFVPLSLSLKYLSKNP